MFDLAKMGRSSRGKKFPGVAMLGWLLSGASLGNSPREIHSVEILPERTYQTIEGFGQGNMDQANVPWFTELSKADREKLLDELYTLNQGGLGLNICRTYIWGGDDPSHEHMWRGPGSQKCIGFEISPGEFVWEGHDSSLWHPRGAQERGATMVAFWNSPPYWMTVSGCSSGSKEKFQNNLRDDMVEAFARHMATVLKHYMETWKIHFQYVSPINEPEAGYWTVDSGQEGCNVDAPQAIRIFKALRRELDRQGIQIKIQGPEAAMSRSLDYLDQLLSDPGVVDAMDVLTCHQYWVDDQSMRAWAQRAEDLRKPLWMSEWGDWTLVGMPQALNYAQCIEQAHRHMRTGVWCMWEPKFLYDQKDGQLFRRPSFYAVAHFSRFLRDGVRMVECISPTVRANAYLNDEELIVVCFSQRTEDVILRLDLSRFKGLGSMRTYRTSEKENMVELPPARARKRTDLLLPAQSIQTLVIPYKELR